MNGVEIGCISIGCEYQAVPSLNWPMERNTATLVKEDIRLFCMLMKRNNTPTAFGGFRMWCYGNTQLHLDHGNGAPGQALVDQ